MKKTKNEKIIKTETKKPEHKHRKIVESLLSKYPFEYKKVKTSEIIVDFVKPEAGLKGSRKRLGETNDIILNELPNLETGKKYHVIDGRKRVNDSLQEKREEIDAKVYKNLPVSIVHRILLVQNLQHSFSPVVEAEAIQAEVKKGVSLKELSEDTGLSKSVLGQRLALLKLPKDILEKLRRNEIKYSTAKRIVKLPLDVQNKIAKEEGKITGDVVETFHRDFLNEQVSLDDMDAPKKPKDAAKVKSYRITCGESKKDCTRKELLSLLEDMIPGLSMKDEIVIKRI